MVTMSERPKLLIGHGEAAVEICKALGLDPKLTAGLEFKLLPNQVVRLTVERYATNAEGRRIGKVLERFNLVPDPDVEVSESDAAVQRIASKP
jgi:hypothetical protein